jgi:hypothetical protein
VVELLELGPLSVRESTHKHSCPKEQGLFYFSFQTDVNVQAYRLNYLTDCNKIWVLKLLLRN